MHEAFCGWISIHVVSWHHNVMSVLWTTPCIMRSRNTGTYNSLQISVPGRLHDFHSLVCVLYTRVDGTPPFRRASVFIQRGHKAHLLSTFGEVSHDAKSTEHRQTANGWL